MLQSGLSRELFERWCTSERNGVIIPGYCVEGTLAKKIMSEPPEIELLSGQKVPLKMSVRDISFSAHADYKETSEFIEALKPPHIVLVHGDFNQMSRLKQKLDEKYSDKMSLLNNKSPLIHIYTPKNCTVVSLTFSSQKVAKAIGSLSSSILNASPSPLSLPSPSSSLLSQFDSSKVGGIKVGGLLVRKEFDLRLISPQDLIKNTSISTACVDQKLVVPLHSSCFHLLDVLEQMYDSLEVTYSQASSSPNNPNSALFGERGRKEEKGGEEEKAIDCIRLSNSILIENKNNSSPSENAVVLKWKSNPITDMLADSVAAIILNIHSHPLSSFPHNHSHPHAHSHPHTQKVKKEEEDEKEEVKIEESEEKMEEEGEEMNKQREKLKQSKKQMKMIFQLLKLHFEAKMENNSNQITVSSLEGNAVLTFDPFSPLSFLLNSTRYPSHSPASSSPTNPSLSCENEEMTKQINSILSKYIAVTQPLPLSKFGL